jgi:hypothetical protein
MLFALIFLFCSPHFMELSSSAVLAIPVAFLSVCAVYLYFGFKLYCRERWLIASGFVFALAFHCKYTASLFFLLVIGDILVCGVIGSQLRKTMIFLLSTIASFSLLAFLISEPSASLSLSTHFNRGVYSASGLLDNLTIFKDNWELILIAACGILVLLGKGRTYPIILFWFSVLIHCIVRPFWDYYLLHIAIPTAWLAGLAIGELMSEPSLARKACLKLAAYLALILTYVITHFPGEMARIAPKTFRNEWDMVEYLQKTCPIRTWLYTDRPLFAFYSNLLIPPEVCVVPTKRILSGQITPNFVTDILRKYNVKWILIARGLRESDLLYERRESDHLVMVLGNLRLYSEREPAMSTKPNTK